MVEVKSQPGLGGWQRGVLEDMGERTAWVRIGRTGELVQVTASRVRPAKDRQVKPDAPPASRPKLARKPSYERPAGKAQPKPSQPLRDKRYLAYVREQPCCSCQSPGPSDPHHFGPHGMGQKTDDYRTSPLCRKCHDHWHDHGALPDMDRCESGMLLVMAQVRLMIGWFGASQGELVKHLRLVLDSAVADDATQAKRRRAAADVLAAMGVR